MRIDKLFGSSDHHSSARIGSRIPKEPNLIPLTEKLTALSECRHCHKTIFYNGTTWRHSNDSESCRISCRAVIDMNQTATLRPAKFITRGFLWYTWKQKVKSAITQPLKKCTVCRRIGWWDGVSLRTVNGEYPHGDRTWCGGAEAEPKEGVVCKGGKE